MQSLLRWSIENSTPYDSSPSDRPPVRREDLNPEIIDMILGKPDAQLMKEDVAIAVDSSKSEDERLDALGHLEMLIENIDNANNLDVLKLWEPLQSILTSEASKEIKVATLWVIGTALQNNPSSQDVYLKINPLPTLLSFLTPSANSTVSERSKAIYTLSGLLQHNAPALKQVNQFGWEQLKNALQDPEIAVRRKAVFLLSALLVPTAPPSPPPTAPTAAPALALSAPAPTSNLSPHLRFTPASTTSTYQPSQSSTALAPRPSSTPQQPSTSFTLHSSETSSGPTASTETRTPETRPTPESDPIHPNSHAPHLRDASRTQTSALTLAALQKYGIVETVVSSLVSPLPSGEDGENVGGDEDYEEKAVKLLHVYAVQCQGPLSPNQKAALKKWIADQAAKLEDRWNLSASEFNELVGAL